MSNLDPNEYSPDRTLRATCEGPFLTGFQFPKLNKETGIKENVEYVFNKTNYFEGPINKDNWMNCYSYLYSILWDDGNDADSDCSKLFAYLDNISKDILALKTVRFNESLIRIAEDQIQQLPRNIEKSFLKEFSIKVETKKRSTPKYRDIQDPSYLKEDEFEYKHTGTWLEQLIQLHFYDDIKELLLNKINNLKSWNKMTLEKGHYPDQVGRRNVNSLAINKLINQASKVFIDKATGKTRWPQVADFLACIYYSDFTKKSYKELIEREQLLYKPDQYGSDYYLVLIDRIRKRASQ